MKEGLPKGRMKYEEAWDFAQRRENKFEWLAIEIRILKEQLASFYLLKSGSPQKTEVFKQALNKLKPHTKENIIKFSEQINVTANPQEVERETLEEFCKKNGIEIN